MNYIRKADLYKLISNLRRHWGLEENEYNLDVIGLCRAHGIQVGEVPFENPGLRGMACLGDGFEPDVILLNSHRNKIEQKIDCSHEAVHLAFHRNISCKSFNCFETALPSQNKYLEWQANEGSAELNVPFQTLLPKIKKNRHLLNTYLDIIYFKQELVQEYNVTDAVISYRLESLKFEIEQFLQGVSMQDLRILSYNSQMKEGITIKSLNDIAMEDLSKDFETKHCSICQSTKIMPDTTFCPICGKSSFQYGEGKMKYQIKIKVNEKSKALRCPICDNEEVSPEGDYCSICGCELTNRCTNVDNFGNGCGALAAANARYCIYCGSETTFSLNKLLIPWDEEQKSLNNEINLDTIMNDWNSIINNQGGGARSYLRNTLLENGGNNCICIVFPDSMSFDMGRRPTVIGELERYIENHYGKSVYFKTRLQNMPILPDGVEYEGLPL
ncbi:ImmA/IrrE family metallo-endopeptidase [Enterocloster citroniae]